ncbi:hypothetical protein JCM19237_339 [Photobacterium aphoticum]|uniref:Uncharacterized protein n=1 Tax=Photobacterium aphoticum TaxID=754436 RepID=A0A090R1H2_9GAMM|nr:hypothetical protein JCM19237_339 [Photobacterium aphoticum]
MSTATISSNLQDAKLLNRYYDRRALSSLPQNKATFQFGRIQWASDLVDLIDGKPVLRPIPNDLERLENVFLTNDAVYTYANGIIYIRCTVQTGALPEGEQHSFSACGILDDAGGLIGVGITPPVWLYKERGMVVEFEIRTNIG